MQQTIQFKTRAVTIYSQSPHRFFARLYVNRTETDLGDATLIARRFSTLRGARDWANRQLQEAT